jgi:Fic family protein
MNETLQILYADLLPAYREQVRGDLKAAFDALQDAELSTDTFSFYTSVSAVYSSKIEGEDIELDSYIRHKRFGIPLVPDYTQKIDDLYSACTFAKTHALNERNLAEAHKRLSKHLVAANYQGVYRTQNMYVTTPDGRIEYVAAAPLEVAREMQKLYADIALLRKSDLSVEEVFYYAAMIHLVFVKIHPWNDGNGRSARLCEKWFLAQKLGKKAWFVESEKMYYRHHPSYYQAIRLLGLEYPILQFERALPFLLMLPGAV